jgi:uncharacterized protein
MLEIGKYNKLKVLREVEFGFYLDGFEWGDILMPRRYAAPDCNIDDEVDVMVYLDGEERLIATTEKPFAQVGEVAFLEVKEVNQFGAFLDWGLKKELFVPFAEQKLKMEAGRRYLVYIFLDEKTERVMASAKLNKFLDQAPPLFLEGQKILGHIWSKTDFAYKVIINSSHIGLLYSNEVFKNLQIGQRVDVYIKKIRNDLKIDLSLSPITVERFDEFSTIIIERLEASNRFIKVSDNSAPELIYSLFGMSKKNFKKALGKLYKERKVMLHQDGIQLI